MKFRVRISIFVGLLLTVVSLAAARIPSEASDAQRPFKVYGPMVASDAERPAFTYASVSVRELSESEDTVLRSPSFHRPADRQVWRITFDYFYDGRYGSGLNVELFPIWDNVPEAVGCLNSDLSWTIVDAGSGTATNDYAIWIQDDLPNCAGKFGTYTTHEFLLYTFLQGPFRQIDKRVEAVTAAFTVTKGFGPTLGTTPTAQVGP